MTLHPDLVRARLEEIARVVAELGKYRGTAAEALHLDEALSFLPDFSVEVEVT